MEDVEERSTSETFGSRFGKAIEGRTLAVVVSRGAGGTSLGVGTLSGLQITTVGMGMFGNSGTAGGALGCTRVCVEGVRCASCRGAGDGAERPPRERERETS